MCRANNVSHHNEYYVSAQDNPGFPKALAIPAAAGSAGFLLSFILSPFELIKVSNPIRRAPILCKAIFKILHCTSQ